MAEQNKNTIPIQSQPHISASNPPSPTPSIPIQPPPSESTPTRAKPRFSMPVPNAASAAAHEPESNSAPSGWLIIAPVLYIALTIFSNLGSLRVLMIAGLSVDGGALLYPFTFTARDMLQKKVGLRLTRLTIWLTAGLNLGLFAFCALIAVLPHDPAVGAQEAFGQVLSPGIRLVLASILAMVTSAQIDTWIYSRVRSRFGSRRQWLRPLASNAVSAPVDTALFLLIAFAGRYSWPVLVSLFVSNLILKYAVTLLSMWGVYLVKEDRD